MDVAEKGRERGGEDDGRVVLLTRFTQWVYNITNASFGITFRPGPGFLSSFGHSISA